MQISFSQKGLIVAVGDRQVLLGQRARMTMAVAFTLLIHLLLLWALCANRTKDMDISLTYDNPVDTELYRPEPIPEEVPPQPLHRLRLEPMPASPPAPRPQIEPAPSPQPSPSPQPMQAQTEPAPQPTPQIKVAPRQMDSLQAVKTPVAKAIPQPQTALQDSPANVPTVSDEPAPTPMKVKKKEEEQALDAKRQMAATTPAPSDLNLHDTPVPSVSSIPVPPSGLTANPSSRLAAGGGTPSAGSAAAAAGGGAGANGLKGRGSASQALQNHDDCVTRQTDGKPIPANCHMKDYASMQSVGPRPDADFQAAAARRDAHLKYKTDPGNYDYWQNVGHNPDAGYHRNEDSPSASSFAKAKDKRIVTNGTGR